MVIATFLLNLILVIVGGLVFYFKADKGTAVKLAVHDQEIASLFKMLNTVTAELKEIAKELHIITLELAGKKPRRKNERRIEITK